MLQVGATGLEEEVEDTAYLDGREETGGNA
jgi:hypothetical protein